MDYQFSTPSVTTGTEYTEYSSPDYSDYDLELNGNADICDRSWVRVFRGQYEPPLFGIIFILGAFGNLLVVWIYTTVKTDQNGQSFCALVYSHNVNNRTKILVLALQICMGFFLPIFIMFFCYSTIIHTLLRARNFEKHKALRVIFAVVCVFVLSQLPHNSLLIVEASQAANTTITFCSTLTRFDIAGQVAKSLAYTHACLNPILYVFIGVRFRKDLVRIVKKWNDEERIIPSP
ncbi:C-C chemokine receptor type 9 [Scomber scombrus]|uniref:C-C chemokine receptor type 9 n=1 Tax=Scomber scombrus TaxID=13677 RepID=A0AAV1P777_SCOSC